MTSDGIPHERTVSSCWFEIVSDDAAEAEVLAGKEPRDFGRHTDRIADEHGTTKRRRSIPAEGDDVR